jgi:hypothetical protein
MESRVRKYDKRRLPRERRSISIFGATAYIDGKISKDQSGKFYRCWNCGFVCNTDRDKLGDGVGFYITDEPDLYSNNQGSVAFQYPCSNASQESATICVTKPSTVRLIQLDSNGDLMEAIHNNVSVITSGCPSCGCKNYK